MRHLAIRFLLTAICFSNCLSRHERAFLVYQPGLNWVQMVVGIGVPVDIKDISITMGGVVKSYYALPDNSTYYTHPTVTIARRKRSTSSISRWKLYYALQDYVERFTGVKDAKSCLLRAICKSAHTPFDDRTGLLSEILHLILTPSSTRDAIGNAFDADYLAAEKLGSEEGRCDALFSCDGDVNFMTRFTKVFM